MKYLAILALLISTSYGASVYSPVVQSVEILKDGRFKATVDVAGGNLVTHTTDTLHWVKGDTITIINMKDERQFYKWRAQARKNEPVHYDVPVTVYDTIYVKVTKADIELLEKKISDLEAGISERDWELFPEQRQAVRDFFGPWWDYIFWGVIAILVLCIVVFAFALF